MIPNDTPGSLTARAKGCICAVIDNSYGAGRRSSHGVQFVVTVGCPVHAPTVPPAEPAP